VAKLYPVLNTNASILFMLEALISSKTRIRLLLRFFLNPESKSYLRELAEEFGESTNSVRLELNRFEKAGMLNSEYVGNKRFYKANNTFPLFREVRSILLKQTGLQRVLDDVIVKLGDLKEVYLTGDLANGRQSNVVSLILVGNPDREYLVRLIKRAEGLIDKKIQYLIYSEREACLQEFESEKYLLLWKK
jgi:DNA-binding transcriptional ArsR family regulator